MKQRVYLVLDMDPSEAPADEVDLRYYFEALVEQDGHKVAAIYTDPQLYLKAVKASNAKPAVTRPWDMEAAV